MITYTVWQLPGFMPEGGAAGAVLRDVPPQEEKAAARAMKATVKDSCALFTRTPFARLFTISDDSMIGGKKEQI
jgi:hypothetical protein